MKQPTDAEKEAFVEGTLKSLRFGGYAGTITLDQVDDAVRITTSKPKRKQKTRRPNSRNVRAELLEVAELGIERLRGTTGRRQRGVPPAPPGRAGLLTPRDVWLSYLRSKVDDRIPDDVFNWGRQDVVDFLRRLPRAARQEALAPSSMNTVILAARRLDKDGVVRLDSDINDIQAGDLNRWVRKSLGKGGSPHTTKTYRDRFRTAVRTYMKEWPREWGDRLDPTRDVDKISTVHVRPPEIGEENAIRLFARLRAMGAWRALASALTAHATGRRIGSISGGSIELHLDAPPLCASDFVRAPDGSLEVVFRAEAQKGGAFGRGDVAHPVTRQLKLVYRWLRRFHKNPLGDSHPLIWSEADPTKPESYDRLMRVFDRAWEQEFGEKKPHYLGWHSFCRTTVTTLVENLGPGPAADYTGRSLRMVETTYRRVRRSTMRGAAACLDDVRKDQRITSKDRAA